MKKSKIILSFLIALLVFAVPCGVLGAGIQTGDDNTGRWIIKVDTGSSSSLSGVKSTARSVEAETDGDLDMEVIGDSVYYITEDYETAKAMAESGVAEYVEEDSYSTLSYTPNDPLYLPQLPISSHLSYQYALEVLNAAGAWDITMGSESVHIAVIDSGFFYGHEDGGNINAGIDYVDEGINTGDRASAHGTGTAGIIAATTNNGVGIAGAAPNCEVYMLRCFGTDKSDDKAYNADIAQAIRDAVDIYKADIISMSFGSDTAPDILKSAIEYAYSKGTILVAATGNCGGAENGTHINKMEYPAAFSEVIGVGSIDWNEIAVKTSTKNKSTYVTAPGADILTLHHENNRLSDYGLADGTSFATPYVAALAGLAKSADSDLTPKDFADLLKYTSRDKGASGYDYSYGYGIADYEALVTVVDKGLFVDVPEVSDGGTWYSEAVYNLKDAGIINGREKYLFEPMGNIKRSEFVKMLATAANADVQAYTGSSTFSDVKSTDWFAPYINWGYSQGIINGYGDGKVLPENNITREEMCAMLNRFINKEGITLSATVDITFADQSSISPWALDDVYSLARAGVIEGEGTTEKKFRPVSSATRAEISAMVNRLIDSYFTN